MSAASSRTTKKTVSRSGSAKEQPIKLQGTVKQKLSHSRYEVALPNGHLLVAYLCGEMQRHFITVNPGDKVELVITPYDLSQGRIVYRF